MHALKIPPEITDEIFSYFVANPDYEDIYPLKAASRVCRHWREVGVRRLFNSIQYSFFLDDDLWNNEVHGSYYFDQGPLHIREFIAFLEGSPLIAAAIRHLGIRNAAHGQNMHIKVFQVQPEYLYTVLKLIPSLCHLFLTDVCFTSAPDVTKVIHLEKLVLQHNTIQYIHRFADIGNVLSMFGTLGVLLVSNVQFGLFTPPIKALAYLRHLRPNVLRWEAKNISQGRFFATMHTILAALHASGNVSYLQDLEVEIYSELGYVDSLVALVRKFVPHVEWLKCRINDEIYLRLNKHLYGHTIANHSSDDDEDDAKDKGEENSNEESGKKSIFESDLMSIERTPLVKLRAVTLNLIKSSHDISPSISQLKTATHLLCLVTQPLTVKDAESLNQIPVQTISIVSSSFRVVELRLPCELHIPYDSKHPHPALAEWILLEDAILQLTTDLADATLCDGINANKPKKEKFVLLTGTKDGARGPYPFTTSTETVLKTLAFKRLNEQGLLRDVTLTWNKWEVHLSSRHIGAYRGSWFTF